MNHPVEILLVEDNPSDAELTLHVLGKNGLADGVHWVHDGAEALDFLFAAGTYADRDPALLPRMLLLDLKLPKVDGLEVLRAAKADPRTRAIPIVVFSSSWEDSDLRRARELGAHSYIVKPLDFSQFAAAVQGALTLSREQSR